MFNIFKEVIIRVHRYVFGCRKFNKLNTVRYVYRQNVPTRIGLRLGYTSWYDVPVRNYGATCRYVQHFSSRKS